jgi:uncharacterized membrane protein YqjE
MEIEELPVNARPGGPFNRVMYGPLLLPAVFSCLLLIALAMALIVAVPGTLGWAAGLASLLLLISATLKAGWEIRRKPGRQALSES